MIKNLNIVFFLIFFVFFNQANAKEIKIIYKIGENIITSFDIDKEIDYLVSLNKNFANFDKKKFVILLSNLLLERR